MFSYFGSCWGIRSSEGPAGFDLLIFSCNLRTSLCAIERSSVSTPIDRATFTAGARIVGTGTYGMRKSRVQLGYGPCLVKGA